MIKKKRQYLIFLYSIIVFFLSHNLVSYSEEAKIEREIILSYAWIVESISNLEPINPGVVFSLKRGRIYCLTKFKSVKKDTIIYHSWYKRDVLQTIKKLTIKRPQWTTYSSIQLREDDKGPWKIVINDKNKKVLKILRISIIN